LLEDLKQIEKNLSTHKINVENINKKININDLTIQDSTKKTSQLEEEIRKLTLKHQDLYLNNS